MVASTLVPTLVPLAPEMTVALAQLSLAGAAEASPGTRARARDARSPTIRARTTRLGKRREECTVAWMADPL